MPRDRLLRGAVSARLQTAVRLALAAWCLASAPSRAAQVGPAASQPDAGPNSQTTFVDYLYPEAFLTTTWVDVDLPTSHVQLADLRIITANRRWSLDICGSPSNPASCVNALASYDPRNVGWRRDFRSQTWSYNYLDLDGAKKLHLRVNPLSGDWMIFRIQVEATPTP